MQRTMAILLAACGGGSSSPPTPAPAPAPVAATPDAPAAFCFPADLHGALSRFTADDVSATLCLAHDKGPTCATVDLATGRYRAASAPPADPPTADVRTDDDGVVSLCKGDACTKLELVPLAPPPDGGQPSHYDVAVSADGKLAVATVPGSTKPLVVLDAATGKELHRWNVGEVGYKCAEAARFVGAVIYAPASVCTSPRARAWLYSPVGTKLAPIDRVNTFGASPVHVAGEVWAVAGFGGSSVELFDTSGREVRTIELPPVTPRIVGDPTEWTASPLVRTPAGTLLLASARGVAMIDPAAPKLTWWPLPGCATAIDPLGPCVTSEGGRCSKHDPLFAEATTLATLPVRTAPTRHYVARIPGGFDLDLEASGRGTIDVYRWAPGRDGWIASHDRFTPAEPGAKLSASYASDAEQRLAVTADTDVVVVLRAKR